MLGTNLFLDTGGFVFQGYSGQGHNALLCGRGPDVQRARDSLKALTLHCLNDLPG